MPVKMATPWRVIAASYMRPTQLRIADVVSRPPDEWDISDAQMEFAYLVDGVMKIDRISQFCHVRPDIVFCPKRPRQLILGFV